MKYIFITGLGRSGTSFITALLSKIEGVYVGHECTGNKEFHLLSWYLSDTNYVTEYLQRVKERIESKIKADWFIDSDSYLRFATDQLKTVFKPEAIFHLVRHPVKVVSSTYSWRNEHNIHLLPKENQSIPRWLDSDRFEQVCCNWKMAVKNLLDKNIPVIKLEDLTTDYNYFSEKMLKPFGFQLSKENWEEIKNKKVNKTRSPLFRFVYAKLKGIHYQAETLPSYAEWSDTHKKIFAEYCFPGMEQLGYKI